MDFRLKKVGCGFKVIPTTPKAKEWVESLASYGPYPGLSRGPIAGLYFCADDHYEAQQFLAQAKSRGLEGPDPFSM